MALKVNKDVRLALIRIGVVLGKDGGALGKLIIRVFSFPLLEFISQPGLWHSNFVC